MTIESFLFDLVANLDADERKVRLDPFHLCDRRIFARSSHHVYSNNTRRANCADG